MIDKVPADDVPALSVRIADARWYDEHYRVQPAELPTWYRFLLPELKKSLSPTSKLVELGCGHAYILRILAGTNVLAQENITGVDQSKTAINACAKSLPKARMLRGDLYDLGELADDEFDVCLLMETIEHLERPKRPIANIWRILKPGGVLYMSFPNFLHLPWLLVRILAEKLNRPNWIVLQPVDKIYTVFGVIRLLKEGGFKFLKGIGTGYGPPVLYKWETDGMARFLNSLGLWRLSFHPILVFRKAPSENAAASSPKPAIGL